jgi:hypothetical protein
VTPSIDLSIWRIIKFVFYSGIEISDILLCFPRYKPPLTTFGTSMSFLGVGANQLRKATLGFVMSVCLSVGLPTLNSTIVS